MPTTRKTSTTVTDSKTHRSSVRSSSKKPVSAPSAPAPIATFDAAVRYQEIATVAYRYWLERDGRPRIPSRGLAEGRSRSLRQRSLAGRLD